jgi:hypothetical protein
MLTGPGLTVSACRLEVEVIATTAACANKPSRPCREASKSKRRRRNAVGRMKSSRAHSAIPRSDPRTRQKTSCLAICERLQWARSEPLYPYAHG